MPRRGSWTLAGAAFALSLSASTAFAGCTGTGALAIGGPGGVTPFLPFASGGAISSLIAAINTSNTAFLTQSTAFVSAPANPAPGQEGGGVWARAIGGEITTKNTTTTSNVQALGVPVPGTITCNNENKLSFAGAQVGTDIASLNVSGWNFHVGTTVGYLAAKSRDVSSVGPLNPLGGTFTDELQVPFVGLYAAATKGGFFIDGQIRRDFYQNSLNDPLVSGLFNQKLDARGLAFSGNIGYNIPLQNNWFIEPSAGVVVSKVKVDPLNVSGSGLAAFLAGGFGTFPGQLRISDINSTLARLSVRGGTTIASGSMIWQPFVTLSVYHEFQGAITSSFDGVAVTNFTGVGGLPSGLVSTSNIGTYGQVGLGVSGQIAGTGLLGYLRGDYREGENLRGYSLNGGIRYQFTPDIVAPRPMYAKAPILKAPAAFVQAYNWTGFFIGGSLGVLNGQLDMDYLAPPFAAGLTANPRFAGALGGFQAGYDYQTGKWVFGVEANINATNARGARPCQVFILVTCEDKKDWIGTATARAGYAFWNRSIVYGRAGAAFTNTTITATCNGNGVIPIGCPATDSQSRVGWTVGFGSEFALSQNWTVRGETNYYDLGKNQYNLQQIAPAPTFVVDVREKGFISTVGLNYRFAPGVVVAKY